MPPAPENSSVVSVRRLSDEIEPLQKRIAELEQQLELARQALETIYRQAHDFGDYWSHDVARDALKKLHPATNPDAQPKET